jgi:hypothetical protein
MIGADIRHFVFLTNAEHGKELIPPAYALAGLYNNPIPARFLALLECLQILAQATLASGIGSLE